MAPEDAPRRNDESRPGDDKAAESAGCCGVSERVARQRCAVAYPVDAGVDLRADRPVVAIRPQDPRAAARDRVDAVGVPGRVGVTDVAARPARVCGWPARAEAAATSARLPRRRALERGVPDVCRRLSIEPSGSRKQKPITTLYGLPPGLSVSALLTSGSDPRPLGISPPEGDSRQQRARSGESAVRKLSYYRVPFIPDWLSSERQYARRVQRRAGFV